MRDRDVADGVRSRGVQGQVEGVIIENGIALGEQGAQANRREVKDVGALRRTGEDESAFVIGAGAGVSFRR